MVERLPLPHHAHHCFQAFVWAAGKMCLLNPIIWKKQGTWIPLMSICALFMYVHRISQVSFAKQLKIGSQHTKTPQQWRRQQHEKPFAGAIPARNSCDPTQLVKFTTLQGLSILSASPRHYVACLTCVAVFAAANTHGATAMTSQNHTAGDIARVTLQAVGWEKS